MEWTQISVITTTEASDLVSDLLIELGSEGTNIKDSADIIEVITSGKNWDYVDKSLQNLTSDGKAIVIGFFSDVQVASFDASGSSILENLTTRLAEFRQFAMNVGSLEVKIDKLDSEDWENVWRKYYSPIEIGSIVIVPEWIREFNRELLPVFIEPGMAFGTGNHETTSMCIKLLQDFDLAGKTIIDVGCGSGILGIAALKLGAKFCYFVDIDSQATESCSKNIQLNNLADRSKVICGDLLENAHEKADVVIANITADILIRLSNDLKSVIREDGKIILSGIIHARAEMVADAFSRLFTFKRREIDGEWQALSYEASANE